MINSRLRKPASGASWNVEEGMARLGRAGRGGRELGAPEARPEGIGRPTGREAGTREAAAVDVVIVPARHLINHRDQPFRPPFAVSCLLRHLWGSDVPKSAGRDAMSFWGVRGGCRISRQRGTEASVLIGGNK
jgi:hypothetical protein